ncbi:MAG: hypothetical protein U9O55_04375 [Patescibacteria group bacterium]|nr:hypothetical protein [Patescibacteria group bacterium]
MKNALVKTLNNFKQILPIILGVLFLAGLTTVSIPKTFYINILGENNLFSILSSALIGSISSGNALTSYILGGEFLNQGVSLFIVTIFMLAWVTVGLIQLPAESLMLGKKFAIIRNITSFISAIIIAFLIKITFLFI